MRRGEPSNCRARAGARGRRSPGIRPPKSAGPAHPPAGDAETRSTGTPAQNLSQLSVCDKTLSVAIVALVAAWTVTVAVAAALLAVPSLATTVMLRSPVCGDDAVSL